MFLGFIEWDGIKEFDTYEEAEAFMKELGDRYLRTTVRHWHDAENTTLYFVEYDEGAKMRFVD